MTQLPSTKASGVALFRVIAIGDRGDKVLDGIVAAPDEAEAKRLALAAWGGVPHVGAVVFPVPATRIEGALAWRLL